MRHPHNALCAILVLLAAGCITASVPVLQIGTANPLSPNVHVFYYPWYGNPETDGGWAHWDHDYPDGRYEPPEQIGANFYPEIGLYSSNDPATLALHMRQIRDAGIGVLATSWWGEGHYTDRAVPQLLDAASACGLKVNFHIEPFPGRSATSFRAAVEYIVRTYGAHPAFFRDPDRGNRPLFYVYDSYLTPAEEWATVLAPDGPATIRGGEWDSIVIALYVKEGDEAFVETGQFDGFYTYFAVDGFVYGSTPAHWADMAAWAKAHGKLFIPSVGPGYIDTRIRPTNLINTRDREGGAYYDRMFKAAIGVHPDVISITSFNEWHEGTQIEPAVPKRVPGFTYLDYAPLTPDYYLKRTAFWVTQFNQLLGMPPPAETAAE